MHPRPDQCQNRFAARFSLNLQPHARDRQPKPAPVCRRLHALDGRQWQHPTRGLHFVVSKRGKHELGLVGGAWDPADGGHPEHDPNALIATATRTFKAATGVDLSACTWLGPACGIFSFFITNKAGAEGRSACIASF